MSPVRGLKSLSALLQKTLEKENGRLPLRAAHHSLGFYSTTCQELKMIIGIFSEYFKKLGRLSKMKSRPSPMCGHARAQLHIRILALLQKTLGKRGGRLPPNRNRPLMGYTRPANHA